MGATVTDPLVGRLVDGRYEVVSRIARGGMATVYLAVDRRLDREVALKVMHPHLAEGTSGAAFVARFRREARTAARLTHPGLVAVFDQGVDGETSYLTMEYVEGETLRRTLGERGALPVGEALQIVEHVLDAVATAHRVGLVHRDVKPENVLIGTDGRVRVGDFGLARAVTEVTSTTTGTVLGTVAYLAPELVAQGASDVRTDVYACGVMLFEMLTGRQPFVGETPIQVAFQHVNSAVPGPSTLQEWLPSEVDELVTALAAREPADRPVDASAAVQLVRRTRASLDDATLARAADVVPAPALLPDLDVDLGADDLAADDDSGRTTVMQLDARGSTVALPIGAVVTRPAEPAVTRRRTGRAWRAVAVVALVLGVLAGGGAWYVLAGPGAYTSVPPLIGASAEEAEEALARAGLGADPSQAFDDVVPEGTVVSTDPGPGDAVRKDGSVAYVVSKGPDLVTVPDGLVGAMQADAERSLEDADLVADYGDPQYHDTAPTGSVLAATLEDGSDAEAGADVGRGATVTLVLSQGPAPVTVTSVVGVSVDDATAQLDRDALKVEASEAYSDDVPAGRIISQEPADGATAHRGDTVKVVVSLGPETVEMPDLTGKQFAVAAKELEELGLTARRENVLGGLFGTVRQQSVEAGQQVRKGTEVVLTVV